MKIPFTLLLICMAAIHGYAQAKTFVDPENPFYYVEVFSDSQMVSPIFGRSDTASITMHGDTLISRIDYLYIGGMPDHYRTHELRFIKEKFDAKTLRLRPISSTQWPGDTISIELQNIDSLLAACSKIASLTYRYCYPGYDTFLLSLNRRGRYVYTRSYLQNDTLHRRAGRGRLHKPEKQQLLRHASMLVMFLPFSSQHCYKKEIQEQLELMVDGKRYSNDGCQLIGFTFRFQEFLRRIAS